MGIAAVIVVEVDAWSYRKEEGSAMARNAVQPRSRVGNVGRMRRMPAAKRSVTRLSRRERPGRLSTYDLSPLPSSYVYLHVYVSKDGGKDTSTRLSLVHPCCFHSKRSDKPLILFIKREINIAFALSAKTEEGVLYAKRERERGAKIGECGRWTFKTDRVSPSTPV